MLKGILLKIFKFLNTNSKVFNKNIKYLTISIISNFDISFKIVQNLLKFAYHVNYEFPLEISKTCLIEFMQFNELRS